MPRGSKPGERRGGRQKGTPNKKTSELQAKIEASGLTPLDYMLSIMRDESEKQAVRLSAARDAAPYVHARLASVDYKGEMAIKEVARQPMSDDEWARKHAQPVQ